MNRYKRMIICIILLYMTTMIAGCKPKETFQEEGTDAITPSIDKQLKQIDSGPASGGTLTLPVTEIDSLSPYRIKDRYVNYVSFFIYESLFNRIQENEVEPWLVDTWSHQAFTTWNFTIRENVRFHHGREMTAYDIRYTMDVLKASESPFYDTGLFDNIQEINIINSMQFEIQLKEPDAEFINKLVFPILSSSVRDQEEFIIGSGPYQFEGMDESTVTLKRNEGWWKAIPPYLDNIVFEIVPESEMLDAFQNNEIEVAFIHNVDFSKYQHRTDMNYQVYPDNKGNFICVSPGSPFGQANRQKALFRYITFRLHDLNLGQVQYFDEFSENPSDIETFKNELVQSGLTWNETRKLFTFGGKALSTVSIVVPKQDLQKLHTANFLVNILADVGIPAEIRTVEARNIKSVLRSGAYDLSPLTEELRPWETIDDTLTRMQENIGFGHENSYILPIYRNQQAILFKNHIRGEKNAVYWNPYQGFQSWYMPLIIETSLEE